MTTAPLAPIGLAPDDPRVPAPLADLRAISAPLAGFWYLGALEACAPPLAAVVGTRRATGYGERITRDLVSVLVEAGVGIVSGLAYGIDRAAHEAALDAGGRTVAVLPGGVDRCTPPAHHALYRRIAAAGCVLSEMPPRAAAFKGSFPRRNRVVAALADLVVVVEAPLQSGAMNTANWALALGREVAAVPGPIDVRPSQGCNRLIRDGAHIVSEAADLTRLLGVPDPPRVRHQVTMDDAQRALWEALADGPRTVDELVALTALPVPRCLASASALRLAGAVDSDGFDVYWRRGGVAPR